MKGCLRVNEFIIKILELFITFIIGLYSGFVYKSIKVKQVVRGDGNKVETVVKTNDKN